MGHREDRGGRRWALRSWLSLVVALAVTHSAAAHGGAEPTQRPDVVASRPACPLKIPLLRADGALAWVRRPCPDDGLEQRYVVDAILEGPTPLEAAAGLAPLLPPDTRLLGLDTADATLRLSLQISSGPGSSSPAELERALGVLGGFAQRWGAQGVRVTVQSADGRRLALSRWAEGVTGARAEAGLTRRGLPSGWRAAADFDPATRLPYGGALAGRTIVLSPGHGWIWDADMGRYRTQRGLLSFEGCGRCQGVIEDFSNAEIVQHHLVPLIEGAGARVVVVRERDVTPAELIIDDQDPGYSEEGAFVAGSSSGGWRDSYRVLPPGEAGGARWALEPPEAGPYQVSVRFRAGGNRATRGLYRVSCAGGARDYVVDQRRSDQRWVYLGEHTCGPGREHSIELRHGPGSAGYLIADAVRLGGGVDSDSGHPRWQMAARHYLPYLGAPAALGELNDVVVRPAYANWVGADAYVSVHTNAFDGSNSGLSSYRYSCGDFPDWSRAPAAEDCDLPAGSADLQESVHAALLAELRQGWDPNFRDVGLRVADFGELRPLEGIPGVLLELAFHDNLRPVPGARMSDNQAIQDPRWRRTVAWGVLRGLVDSLRGPDVPLPPRAPQGLVCVPHVEGGAIQVAWEPVVGARGYVIEVARGERGFDGGTLVEGPTHTLPDVPAGVAHMVRVRAAGDGGLGPASEVGAAALSDPAAPRYRASLLVQGFDRQDAWVRELDNTRSYLTEHALALAAAGPFPFGSAANEALAHPWVVALDPAAVLWALGEEATEPAPFGAEGQRWLDDFTARGGSVWASGSEAVWALDERGSPEDQAFLERVFGTRLQADDAEVHAVVPLGLPPFDSLPDAPIAFDDGTHGTYDVDWPDVLRPAVPGAVAVLGYPARAGAAGVAYEGPGHRSVVLGVPLETLISPDARVALFAGALPWLLPPAEPPGPAGPDAGPSPDAGVSPEDAGPWPDDGGEAPDAGSSSTDEGIVEPDAGAPPSDLGSPLVDLELPSVDLARPVDAAPPPRDTGAPPGGPDASGALDAFVADGAGSADGSSGADSVDVDAALGRCVDGSRGCPPLADPGSGGLRVAGIPGRRAGSEAGCGCDATSEAASRWVRRAGALVALLSLRR